MRESSKRFLEQILWSAQSFGSCSTKQSGFTRKRSKTLNPCTYSMHSDSCGIEELHATEAQVTRKTWRKWCWLYIEGIAGLAKHVVSLLS